MSTLAPPADRLAKLERALRNADAAGDTAAARRFAQEIRRLRGEAPTPAEPEPAATPPALSRSMAAALAEDAERHEPDYRGRGAQTVTGEGGGERVAAAFQGYGSGLFGAGTPVVAAGEMIASAMPGGRAPMTPLQALEWARGRRDALREEYPREFYAGMGSSIVGGIGAARAAAKLAPGAAGALRLQEGQRLANAGRLAAGGAAAGGVTALNEEGLSAVPEGAGIGAVAAPIVGGVAGGAAHFVKTRLGGPAMAAARVLSKKLGEPVDAIAQRIEEFRTLYGHAPRLAEIVRGETAEELGQIGQVHAKAGNVLRTAAEEASLARQREVPSLIRAGGRVTSAAEAEAFGAETVGRAAERVGRRVNLPSGGQKGTARQEVEKARVRFREVMGRIGGHQVPLTADMADLMGSPNVIQALPAQLRRRIADRIEGDAGAAFTVQEWNAIRDALGKRAKTDASGIYTQLRNDIRDYVGRAVPEYESLLSEFGRRKDVARGIAIGTKVADKSPQEFAARLRTAGGGTEGAPLRPEVRVQEQAGARVGARRTLANLLSNEESAERTMRRLARDPGFRSSVRAALSQDEADELVRLARRYGQTLDFTEGVKLGQKILSKSQGTEFVEEAAQSARGTPRRVGIERGARGALAAAAGESAAGARNTLESIAEDAGLRSRLQIALGMQEAGRLQRIGEVGTRAARNLEAASPAGTSASRAAAEDSRNLQKWIAVVVILAKRASGALIANTGNWIVQNTSLSAKTAKELAEMAVDPARADQAVAALRRVGLEADEIRRMYQTIATGTGVAVGAGAGPD